MRFPEDYHLRDEIAEQMDIIAVKLSIEYGIAIEVWTESDDEVENTVQNCDRIYFKVMDSEFDSLRDLRKALRNKVFM